MTMPTATIEPPQFRKLTVDPQSLKLGAHFAHVDYEWRRYEDRRESHRRDYDRLEADIRKNGITNPLICYGGQVLIGMRRCEIAVKLGIPSVEVWEITEDIAEDWTPARVFALRDCYAKAEY